MDSPRLLQAEIHNNYSTISGTWDAYKTQIAGLYSATGYAASGSAAFQDFSNHLMREYNTKIIKLNMSTGMLISPYDAGYRFTGVSFEVVEAFSPLSLFSSGEQGVWYDPSDLTTMFESADGSTAVHTPGNGTADSPVGLLLDKRLGLQSSTKGGVGEAIGGQYFSTPYKSITTENIDIKARFRPTAFTGQTFFAQDSGGSTRNFVFSLDSAKTLSFIWWESSGQLRSATSTVAATLTAGTTYWFRVTLSINNTTQAHATTFYCDADTGSNTQPSSWTQLGSVVNQGGFNSNVRNSNCQSWVGANFNTTSNNINGKIYFASVSDSIDGAAVQTFTPTDYSSGLTFTSSSGDVWTIRGAARIVPDGNHATQTTSTARPTLSARHNLFTYSEQFNNGYWTKTASTISADATTAPDGTTTADALYETTATDGHWCGKLSFTGATSNFTFSVCLKAGTRTWAYMALYSGSAFTTYATYFDLQNGVVGNNPAGTTASITSLGDGWYRCSITRNDFWLHVYYGLTTGNGAGTYAGDVTKYIYAWGADIRFANSVGLPAYQRISDANTYDSVGFPYYIKFDGTDDYLTAGNVCNILTADGLTAVAGALIYGAGGTIYAKSLYGGATGRYALNRDANVLAGFVSIDATAGTATASVSDTSTVSRVITSTLNPRVSSSVLRINSSQVASGTNAGLAGSISTTYRFLLGAYNNGTDSGQQAGLYLNGRIYGLVLRVAISTTTERNNTETWMNGKTKAY